MRKVFTDAMVRFFEYRDSRGGRHFHTGRNATVSENVAQALARRGFVKHLNNSVHERHWYITDAGMRAWEEHLKAERTSNH